MTDRRQALDLGLPPCHLLERQPVGIHDSLFVGVDLEVDRHAPPVLVLPEPRHENRDVVALAGFRLLPLNVKSVADAVSGRFMMISVPGRSATVCARPAECPSALGQNPYSERAQAGMCRLARCPSFLRSNPVATAKGAPNFEAPSRCSPGC